ncbi:hypothetical protein MTR67_018712 [Solanum verrucosum]|uniref:Uncharacterized protein n=1 Tax=Solanum verrucosum TaxID=315347 RepID=A0AAF0TLT4_SOLVR|nr:hypothetical protein MTR67_018712 [Solanum verrucosum]
MVLKCRPCPGCRLKSRKTCYQITKFKCPTLSMKPYPVGSYLWL